MTTTSVKNNWVEIINEEFFDKRKKTDLFKKRIDADFCSEIESMDIFRLPKDVRWTVAVILLTAAKLDRESNQVDATIFLFSLH